MTTDFSLSFKKSTKEVLFFPMQREIGTDEEDKKKGNGKSSVSTKRSRAAAIHNQSERVRN